MIRIVIVDDHAVVRSGLRLLLERRGGHEVVGDAGDAREAVFEVRAQKPDVVLLDVVDARRERHRGAAEAAARGAGRPRC